MLENKFVFVCGLHRSGTSVLNKVLASQPNISGFNNTGVPRDEGQHLQTVFNPASYYGGPGKFGFHPDAALTEESPIITDANKKKLQEEWFSLWDLDKPILIEKSPPNLIRTRFLQEMFPNSYFITIIRHPIAVSYATQKWSNTSVENLIQHWLKCHHIYEKDRTYLRNELSFSYEKLVTNPKEILKLVAEFLNTEIIYSGEFSNENEQYFQRWNRSKLHLLHNMKKKQIIDAYEERVNHFGYSLVNLNQYPQDLKVNKSLR